MGTQSHRSVAFLAPRVAQLQAEGSSYGPLVGFWWDLAVSKDQGPSCGSPCNKNMLLGLPVSYGKTSVKRGLNVGT